MKNAVFQELSVTNGNTELSGDIKIVFNGDKHNTAHETLKLGY